MKWESGWYVWYWWRFKIEWKRGESFMMAWGDRYKPPVYTAFYVSRDRRGGIVPR